MAARQAQHFGRHHQTHHVIRQILADTDAVRQHQIALQFRQTLRRNTRLCQLAETGIDAVDHFPRLNNAGDRFLRRQHACARLLSQFKADIALINLAQHRQINMTWLQAAKG